jgi:putative ATP-dependent endonuclease of OLD family
LDVLVEARGTDARHAVRMAVGKLYDYRRFEATSPGLAVLLPREAVAAVPSLLGDLDIGCVRSRGERMQGTQLTAAPQPDGLRRAAPWGRRGRSQQVRAPLWRPHVDASRPKGDWREWKPGGDRVADPPDAQKSPFCGVAALGGNDFPRIVTPSRHTRRVWSARGDEGTVMLTQLYCFNFRSLQQLELQLDPLTCLVGPNGSGKSAVLDAIDLVLGQRWPTLGSIDVPYDFTNFEVQDSALAIRVDFDPPFIYTDAGPSSREVTGVKYTVKTYERAGKHGDVGDLRDNFEPIGSDGKRPMEFTEKLKKGHKSPMRPMYRVTNDMRDHARVLKIDSRRDVLSHLPGRRYSALRQLLEPARKEFDTGAGGAKEEFKERFDRAMDALRTPQVKEIEETIQTTARQMLGFLGTPTLRGFQTYFSIADPANPFNSLRISCREGELALPAERMGLGIQSAIVVGVFEAIRRLGANVMAVLLEEPETYLHPQAQRYFHRLLIDITEESETQVIYTTHSPIFADMTRFESVRLMRRTVGQSSTVSQVDRDSDRQFLEGHRTNQKLDLHFDQAGSEALFADRVLLVEGQADRIAIRHVALTLNVDLDAENISVVDCGGKSAIPFFATACRALDIPFAVLHDVDVIEPDDPGVLSDKQKQSNRQEADLNQRIADAVADAAPVFKMDPSLESVLGIGANARDKPRRVLEELEQRSLEHFPRDLVEATRAVIPDEVLDVRAQQVESKG